MSDVYSICHKCSLPRDKQIKGLSKCLCLGQTEFAYEREKRGLQESLKLARQEYLERIDLYKLQGRKQDEFDQLVKDYQRVA